MKILTATLTAFVLLALVSPVDAQTRPQRGGKQPSGKIYCWDTPQGRQCGDTLPAEAAGARREEFSSRTGNIVNEVDRAKTEEEIEAERLAQEQARHHQEELDRITRDRNNLRLRYESVDAIRAEYESRRQALEVGLGLAENSEKSSHRSLVSALDDLAGLELSGRPVNDKAFSRLADLHKEWARQRETVNNARQRIIELDAERDQQIELWSQPDQGISPTPQSSSVLADPQPQS